MSPGIVRTKPNTSEFWGFDGDKDLYKLHVAEKCRRGADAVTVECQISEHCKSQIRRKREPLSVSIDSILH